MAEETKTQAVYESKVLKRIQNVAFHTCKSSTYKARKFQVRIAKEYMVKLIADLPEDAQVLAGLIKTSIEKYATFTSWVTVEFLNSNNKLNHDLGSLKAAHHHQHHGKPHHDRDSPPPPHPPLPAHAHTRTGTGIL